MRIGILTGGGDVPGLNSCIKAVVTGAERLGWDVVGIRLGWGGLLQYDLANDEQSRLTASECSLAAKCAPSIATEVLTSIHHAQIRSAFDAATCLDFLRTDYPFPEDATTVDCTPHVLRVIERPWLDTIVPIGGDDTLSFAARLHHEGVPIVAIPKTMDNDVFGTDYCIGFSTAVTRSVEAIHQLRTPTGSHERIGVIELFGRNSGETALITGYLADVDRVLISEVPFDIERLAGLVTEDRRANPSHYAMVIVSEGASMLGGQVVSIGQEDAYGHRKLGGIGQAIGDALKNITGIETVQQQLGYLMRAGAPNRSMAVWWPFSYGTLAVQLIARHETGRMVALRQGRYTTVPVETPTHGAKRVDIAELYDVEQYRPRVAHLLDKPMFLY